LVALPSTWFVGCGHMAGALIEGWRKSGVDFSAAVAIRPSGREVAGIRTVASLPDEPAPLRCVLGFKPQLLGEVAPELAPRLSSETVLVSMLAGVDVRALRALFPAVQAVVRIMPNLPVSERRGVTALYGEDAEPELRRRMQLLFGLLGMAVWTDTEVQLSAIGAVAGAGPAYVARFAAAMAKGGEGLGLEAELAEAVAVQTLVGTGALAAATKESMADIARRVASPKGTTEQGLAVLDAPDGLQPLIDRMLAAAFRRAEELAAEARRD
jgi:pyrroline-5-carboxylate reductase